MVKISCFFLHDIRLVDRSDVSTSFEHQVQMIQKVIRLRQFQELMEIICPQLSNHLNTQLMNDTCKVWSGDNER